MKRTYFVFLFIVTLISASFKLQGLGNSFLPGDFENDSIQRQQAASLSLERANTMLSAANQALMTNSLLPLQMLPPLPSEAKANQTVNNNLENSSSSGFLGTI